MKIGFFPHQTSQSTQANYRKQFTDERLLQLLASSEREHLLHDLIALYEQVADCDAEAAREVRRAFLLALRDAPHVEAEERLSHFLANQIEPEDYVDIHWETPEQVVTYCEVLYGFRFDTATTAEQVSDHVMHLLRQALHYFEQRGEQEKIFRLFQIAPIPPTLRDPELLRLRNRAYLYEMRRVRRFRRILYGYLILQVFLVVLVFPLLFINAENGAIQETVEETAKVNMPAEVHRNITYSDALYWSLITAGSIGYGDLTPMTQMGKAIAATLGIMGVITIGVIAGLILNWITPRRLD